VASRTKRYEGENEGGVTASLSRAEFTADLGLDYAARIM